jgi:hypothetical protein
VGVAVLEASGSDDAPSPLGVLVAPDRGMERQARVGRARWFFLIAWLCSILLGAAIAYRLDATSSTLKDLDRGGQLATMSDRQVVEAVAKASRIAQVASVGKGIAATPIELGLLSLAVVGLCWFLRGRLSGRAVAPVAAAALVPGAIANLVDAVTALRHVALPAGGAPLAPRTLSAMLTALGHAPAGPWLKLGNAADLFSLWAAILLGFGVAAAGRLPKTRALVGALAGWICLQLVTRVALT